MSLKWEYEELFESFMEDYTSYKNANMSDAESLLPFFSSLNAILLPSSSTNAIFGSYFVSYDIFALAHGMLNGLRSK